MSFIHATRRGDANLLNIDQHLGARIASARKALGKSQAELAETIEVSEEHYAQIEMGQVRIRAIELSLLAHALGRSIKWLYEGLPGQEAFDDLGQGR